MAPHAPLAAADVSEKAKRDLLRLLDGVRGKKNLVLEKAIAGPLNLLVKFSTLQEYGVDKPFFLENNNVDSSQRNVVFLARGEKAKSAFSIAEQIKRLRRDGQIEHEFTIIWAPRRTLVSDQILEESGVLGEADVREYPLYFVPLADDVLSLELEDSFSDLYLRKDANSVFLSAKALMQLQQKHGLFPRIMGKGDNAKRLVDLLTRMRSEITAGEDSSNGLSALGLHPSSSIESLIIVDREVDFLTPLLTQLTYEGLIDEVFTIQSNNAEVDSSIVSSASSQQSGASQSQQQQQASMPASQLMKRKIALDPKDPIYSTLMDANFAVVSSLMNRAALRLQASYDSKAMADKTTSELREIVSRLPGYQVEKASLALHTSLAEEIFKHTRTEFFSRALEVQQNLAAGADPSSQHDALEELLARDLPISSLLRLLCIESVASGGFRARDLETFKRAVVHAYGPQHLLTLASLEKAGLLVSRVGTTLGLSSARPGATNYNAVRKNLRLIVDDVNESEPDDIAYAYSGYAPLSVRLVQCVLQKAFVASPPPNPSGGAADRKGAANASSPALTSTVGWRPFEDALKSVAGATVDEIQTGEEKAVRARQILQGGGASADNGKMVIVFFLGGVCRAEVAALRFVAKKMAEAGSPRRLMIATTSIVNGAGIVGCAIEQGRFAPPPPPVAQSSQ